MDRQTFTIDGKTATLYPGGQKDRPLIVLNTFTGDGASVVEAMEKIDTPDCNVLVVGELNWDHDMTPWYCPPLSANDTPCTGGAEEYLEVLTGKILPEALERIDLIHRNYGIVVIHCSDTAFSASSRRSMET